MTSSLATVACSSAASEPKTTLPTCSTAASTDAFDCACDGGEGPGRERGTAPPSRRRWGEGGVKAR